MWKIIDIFLLIGATTVLVPILVLSIECFAALLPGKSEDSDDSTQRPQIAVLVPAHNEASGIAATLQAIQPQLTAIDRLVVVADNCEDETAAIARNLGATVVERQDPEKKGKGYALDYGIQYLAADPPEVVVIIDADCDVSPETIEKIATLAEVSQKPVQATYLMAFPPNSSLSNQVSAFAFKVKNLVRPFGLRKLGLPCSLMGTGMAFPWSVISQAPLASGNIVEDMQLGVDLAICSHSTIFCADTVVQGRLPQQQEATVTQKTRWEHGHLQIILTQSPKLVKEAIKQKRWELLTMALDLSVPPLSLLTFLWLAIASLSLFAGILGGIWSPIILSSIAGLLLFSSIIMTWAKFARDELQLSKLFFIPVYMLQKIPLYLRFLVKPQKIWIRTQRD
ncbi:glycosyltransferase family 2 protein [Merismopedia glauca]|uniref:Glycosyl transferase n=1 Tax=Merismopedia glauca CCAP 1448/3 TaxID=1296344 RepID=A0A2T1C4L1_9CYAN|nr:glycosyltransferase family 2 protein [Merismopedia glauca]PSB03077.1 glycosyl transferase [Merismopedia glauca CCAP 1448/3]